jgi:flavin-dependent dehydrogenase
MDDCELAIIGGGPAGVSTALFLAHADPSLIDRIVVLEKETYPRDKFCGGALGLRGDSILAEIGVRVEVPSVEIKGLSLATAAGSVCEHLREPIGRVVRRIEFDHELARVARKRGIRIEEGAAVAKIELGEQGVTLDTARGPLRAAAVIGADGVGSVVRRTLGLPAGKLRAQVVELDTEEVAGDPARDVLHFDIADQDFVGYVWDFPTLVDGQPLICRGIYHLKLDDKKVDIVAMLAQRLRERGLSIERYRLKRFSERGFEPHLPYAAPRMALVGEAAGIDALSGEGIAQAIEYGAFAGPYLADKLAQRDFRFHDWQSKFGRSKLGFDLRFRERLVPYAFGRHRARIERHLLLMPEFVTCSMQQFAGLPVDNLGFARAAAGTAFRVLRSKLPWSRTI